MKTILCYGDSNTYGYRPDGRGRYTKEERWTGILSERLKEENIEIIEEGLVGRITVFEDLFILINTGSAIAGPVL